MSDDEKVDETTEEEVSSEEKVEEKSETDAEEDSSSKIEDKDYEDIQKEEESRKPDPQKAREAFKKREEKREQTQEEDKPLTRSEMLEILSQRDKGSNEERALAIARQNTKSEAAARAALAFWKNRVSPSGNLEEDVLFAIGGMERKVLQAKNLELARALKGRETTYSDSAGTQRDGMEGTKPKLPDESPLKEYEFKGNGIYAQKLKSGKTHYVNKNARPGEKRSWFA